MFVIFFISGIGRDRTARRSTSPEGEIGDRRRLLRRIFVDGVRAVLSRRIRQHDPDERDDERSCFSAAGCAPFGIAPFTWVPGADLVLR